MKYFLFFILTLNTVFGADFSWTSLKTCHGGYDIQAMLSSTNGNYLTKYVMSLRRESFNSLLEQLIVTQKLTQLQILEVQQFEVYTTSYGHFEGQLSFGKVVANEYENGAKVELLIFDNQNKKVANYYYNSCF